VTEEQKPKNVIQLRVGNVINIAGAPFRIIGIIKADETMILKRMSPEDWQQYQAWLKEQIEKKAKKDAKAVRKNGSK